MRWLVGLCLVLGGVVLATNPGSAGVLDASWTAPTTNTDGSPLTDLASYRVYYVAAPASPCLGSTFGLVASPTPNPPPGQIVSARLTGLTTGTPYNVAVTAVDTSGSESACSNVPPSALAALELSVAPTGATNFGNVNLGSFSEQIFTVQNTRTAPVSGTASVSAPFTIVSGSAFTIAGSGTTQVTVRFTPTALVTSTTNVNFTADGDSISRSVTGIGFSTTFPLTVSKTGAGSGTVTSNPAGISCGVTCSAAFATGTMVTLTATPAAGSIFSGWSGGSCTGTGTCTVTLSAATTVTATFAVQTFTLTVSKTGVGTGTVTSAPAGISCGASCSAAFATGTMVTLTAAPAAGSTFTGWSGSCTGTGACTATMSAARAVTASFSITSSGFTDDPLVAQTTAVKAVHIVELRTAIASLRTRNGLPAFTWTDATLTPGTSPFKAVHILEVRTALNQVYQALGRSLPTYTDPTIVAGQTMSKAAHVQELRNAVRALP